MRQAGYLAAAGSYVGEVLPVETNIVIFDLNDKIDSDHFLDHLRRQSVLASSIKGRTIRFVFHLDITDAQFDQITDAIGSFGR